MHVLERESQLSSLAEYAAQARTGHGRVVLISGEAGVGKSTLVEHFAAGADDAAWWWSACIGQFIPRPLGPLLDIADTVGGNLAELCRGQAPREVLFAALADELRAAQKLTAVVVEDLHWADEATLDLVRFLARQLRDAPVLLLLTYRDDALAPTDPLRVAIGDLSAQRVTRRIDLSPLTARAVAHLAEGSGVGADELYRLTGGNPFFVTEVLSTGIRELPPSARDAVLARAATLGAEARELLDIAALMGTRIEPALLLDASGASGPTADEVVHAGLLRGDGEWLRFRHEIARLAVESSVSPHRRLAAHRAVLDALVRAGNDDDARLAFHAEGSHDETLVTTYAPRAARRAAELGAHREAAAQLERALRFAGGNDARTRAELLDALADELTFIDRWDDSATARQGALELWKEIGDRLRQGDDLRRLSVVMWRLCRGPECVAAAESAVQVLEPLGPTPELAWAYVVRAGDTDDPEAAMPSVRTAREIAATHGLADLESYALNWLAAMALATGGDWETLQRAALTAALESGADEHIGRSYANLHANFVQELRFEESERWFVEGVAYCDARDMTTFSTCLRGRRALALMHRGRWEEALLVAGQVLATRSSPVNLMTSQVATGLVRARQGHPDVWPNLDAALAAAEGLAEAPWLALVHGARAEAYWLAGDHERAADALGRARAVLTPLEPHEAAAVAVWERRLGLATAGGTDLEPGATTLTDDHRRAARLWDDLGCPYDAALALADSEDESDLRESFSRLEVLGATATALTLRRRMRSLGIRSVPAGARATTREHPLGLTRREQEVLDLVAVGQTNDEISQRLVISVKTVDHHVSAVLSKLGVGSRRQAATEAARLGLVDTKTG